MGNCSCSCNPEDDTKTSQTTTPETTCEKEESELHPEKGLLFVIESETRVVNSVEVPQEFRKPGVLCVFSGIILSPPKSSILYIRADVKGTFKCILAGNVLSDTLRSTNTVSNFELRISVQPNTYYPFLVMYSMGIEYQLKVDYRFDTDRGYFRQLKHTYHLSPTTSLLTETFRYTPFECRCRRGMITVRMMVGIIGILIVVHLIRTKR